MWIPATGHTCPAYHYTVCAGRWAAASTREQSRVVWSQSTEPRRVYHISCILYITGGVRCRQLRVTRGGSGLVQATIKLSTTAVYLPCPARSPPHARPGAATNRDRSADPADPYPMMRVIPTRGPESHVTCHTRGGAPARVASVPRGPSPAPGHSSRTKACCFLSHAARAHVNQY